MQTERAVQLRKLWADKGNPPCKHPRTDQEYYLGSQSPDRVCVTCGTVVETG